MWKSYIYNYGIASDNVRQMNTYSSNTIGKFRVSWKKEIGTAINKRDISWPMLRYADVLLMYAEALNEFNNGPTQEAINKFEEVRARGYGNDKTKIGTTPGDYQGFKNAIINERKLELGFESLRRTDLIRWGIHFETLIQTKQNVIDMANRAGNYTDIDLYRAYKKEVANSFEDDVTAVPFIGFKIEPDVLVKADLEAQGYVLLEMHGSNTLSYKQSLDEGAVWVTSLFRGLEKNKVELVPLHTTNIIDVNPGLTGQQHPLY